MSDIILCLRAEIHLYIHIVINSFFRKFRSRRLRASLWWWRVSSDHFQLLSQFGCKKMNCLPQMYQIHPDDPLYKKLCYAIHTNQVCCYFNVWMGCVYHINRCAYKSEQHYNVRGAPPRKQTTRKTKTKEQRSKHLLICNVCIIVYFWCLVVIAGCCPEQHSYIKSLS